MSHKTRGVHVFELKPVLNTAIESCHPHPSHFMEVDLLFPSLNIPRLPPLLYPSQIRTSLSLACYPCWTWHVISLCATKISKVFIKETHGCMSVLFGYFFPILCKEKGVRITLVRNVRLKNPLLFRKK